MSDRQTRIEWIAGWLAYARWILRYTLRQTRERATIAVAWLLPRYLVYWAAIRVGAHATVGKYGNTEPGTLPFTTALQRWQTPNGR